MKTKATCHVVLLKCYLGCESLDLVRTAGWSTDTQNVAYNFLHLLKFIYELHNVHRGVCFKLVLNEKLQIHHAFTLFHWNISSQFLFSSSCAQN